MTPDPPPYLDVSSHAARVVHSAQTLAEHALETPLRDLARREIVAVGPDTPLKSYVALRRMVVENLAGVERALAAQKRDAAA